jgi:hypothetical protein
MKLFIVEKFRTPGATGDYPKGRDTCHWTQEGYLESFSRWYYE